MTNLLLLLLTGMFLVSCASHSPVTTFKPELPPQDPKEIEEMLGITYARISKGKFDHEWREVSWISSDFDNIENFTFFLNQQPFGHINELKDTLVKLPKGCIIYLRHDKDGGKLPGEDKVYEELEEWCKKRSISFCTRLVFKLQWRHQEGQGPVFFLESKLIGNAEDLKAIIAKLPKGSIIIYRRYASPGKIMPGLPDFEEIGLKESHAKNGIWCWQDGNL